MSSKPITIFPYRRMWRWVQRAFRTGPAEVDYSESQYGHSQEDYAPAEYGDYSATSVGVYACTTLRADNLSGLPVRLTKTGRGGQPKEVTTGKLYDLLQTVNKYWTFPRLVNMTEQSMCMWGQAFWCLERGKTGRGVPSEIWWARPDRMQVIPDPVNYISGFEYDYNGTPIPFRPEEVVWFRYANPADEFSGLSPIAAARLSIDTGTAAIRSNKKLFEKGMQLGGIITPEDPSVRLTKEQTEELELKFEKRFQGVDKAHRWAILSGGLKVMPLGLNPKDAEFMALMQWTLNDVCRVYKVPPPMVQDFTRSTYDNNEQADKSLWQHCLIPEARFLAQEMTEQLLPLFPGEADRIDFDLSNVLSIQEDRSEIVEQMASLWDRGVPMRDLLEQFMPSLLPKSGRSYAWYEVGYLPSTVQPADAAGEQQEPDAEPEEGGEGQRGAIADRMRRALAMVSDLRRLPAPSPARKTIEFGSEEHARTWKAHERRSERWERRVEAMVAELWRRQQESVLARLRGGKGASGRAKATEPEDMAAESPFDKPRWGKEFKAAFSPVLAEIVQGAAEDVLDGLGVGTAFDVQSPEVIRFLEGRAQRFARQVNDTTWDDLKGTLSEGIKAGESVDDLAERVRDTFRRYSEVEPDAEGKITRARTIARTETNGAMTGGHLRAAKQSGVVEMKTWITTLDGRERGTHNAAHGQTVPLDKDFSVGAGSGPGPGMIGLPEEDCNCRCTTTFLLKP